MSHAMMPHDSAKVEKAEASSGHGDCHKHTKVEQSGKTTQNDKKSDDCCKEGVCKCIGGTCHNGISKTFSTNDNVLLSISSGQTSISSTNDVVESALANRLKRPPKA